MAGAGWEADAAAVPDQHRQHHHRGVCHLRSSLNHHQHGASISRLARWDGILWFAEVCLPYSEMWRWWLTGSGASARACVWQLPEREARSDYAYGDHREMLAVSAGW
eukprot:1052322-Rhodomonas_salina.1